jgi:hypothetical protein
MAWQKPEPQNVKVSVEESDRGDVIVIRIDPKARFGPSSSGKTIIVAKGSVDVPEFPGMSLSLTAYTK